MDKAFLCHSSTDKEYVERVAKRLGRAKVVFDAMSFRAGHDFREEIQKGLEISSLFVFFVSRASLDSTWCCHEVDEAQFKKITGEIRGQLVIIIDPEVNFSDLPKWMQRLRAILQPRAVQAAREIERELFAISPASLKAKPFVGRQALQQEFVERLSVGMEVAPRIFVVSGLEGVGRRSYLARALQDNLGLTLGPFRIIDTTSTLEDLFIWLVDETSDVMTREELAAEAALFRNLAKNLQAAEVLNRLRLICGGRFSPCLIDQGGMLGESGEIREPYASILDEFASSNEDAYLSIVSTRAPRIDGAKYSERTSQQRIQPLRPPESRILLQQLMRHEEISMKDAEAEELTGYIDGYPPAAYFLARQAKTYGLATTVADKSLLVDFKARRFTRFLLDLHLSDHEWDVLTYLASEQSIPLGAVAVALARVVSEVAQITRNLIDNSLVVVSDDNLSVSPPIRDAITRAKGHLSLDVYSAICERLTKAFWSFDNPAPSIEVVDATLHAVARSGSTDFNPYKDLVRVSIVHRLAQESYHRREYPQALEYATRAEAMGADNHEIRALHFKALVHCERWEDAKAELEGIKKHGDKNYLFLKGFMLRRQRQYKAAIEAYEAALQSGDNSFPLRRDYADCLHRTGRLKEATAQIRSILDRQTENIFVLDLALRIYVDGLKSGQNVGITKSEVDLYLQELERFDVDQRFIHHRRATILAAQQQWNDALVEISKACTTNPNSFESLATRIDIMIELERFAEAKELLREIARRFQTKKDVQLGLRIKLAIRQGDWHSALTEWNNLSDKKRQVHQALLMRIKELQAKDMQLSLVDRAAASSTADKIRAGIDLPQSSPDGLLYETDEEAGED